MKVILGKPASFWRLSKQVPDQIAHFAWSFGALAPVLLWPTWWGGALGGFILCAPREWWDQKPATGFVLIPGWGKVLDILFFVAGGAAVGFLLGV